MLLPRHLVLQHGELEGDEEEDEGEGEIAKVHDARVAPARGDDARGGKHEDEEDGDRLGDRIVLDIEDTDEVVGAELILRVTAGLEDQTWSDELRVEVADEN